MWGRGKVEWEIKIIISKAIVKGDGVIVQLRETKNWGFTVVSELWAQNKCAII